MRQRQPRIEEPKHIKFIQEQACVICGWDVGVDAAHLKAGNHEYGKDPAGTQRPSDCWTTPLCRKHHSEQHSMGEIRWWNTYGIRDPWRLCKRLYEASGDHEAAAEILRQYRPRVASYT